MRARNAASFFIICALAASLLGLSPAPAKALQTIMSQSSGFNAPYTKAYSSNIWINDPAFLVATGTIKSISFAPAVSRGSIADTDTFSYRFYNYYYGRDIDCATPAKTAAAWGMTRIVSDPNAPTVNFPFSGTQCAITSTSTSDADRTGIMLWPLRNGASDGKIGIMGNATGKNYIVYGQDIADPATAPTLTLNGSATTTAEFGETYTDLGATANDAIDGSVTSAIHVTGTVDTNLMGTTTLIYAVTNSSGLSATTTRDVIVACTHDCYSSVLFLPGIQGSRLYTGEGCVASATEEKLWEPYESWWTALLRAGDAKVRKLFLNASGKSSCDKVYVKTNGVIDSVAGSDIYKTLISEMNGLQTSGDIREWAAVAYDWRLSLDDLLNKGAERDGKIFYADATSTPYIEQTLRTLAARSRTGKVTIIAHSNGGLLAKALMQKLGSETSKSLVENLVMVGAPQSGAPEAVGATLVGHNAGIYAFSNYFPIVSNSVAKELAGNSPMAYHLLPSQSYFDSVMDDPNHPVSRFAGDGYASEISKYGNAIGTVTELYGFLRDSLLNSSLIDYAGATHSSLDSWTPPEGIMVSQVAGWGADTTAGIDFYTPAATDAITALEPMRSYRPISTEDGDGIVPTPSALMMSVSANVKRYWVNLFAYSNETELDRRHKDLFEIPQLEEFIKNIIKNSTSTLPAYISTTQPPTNTEDKKLTFYLHSPLTLQLTDASGRVTGIGPDDAVTQDIPDSSYGEFGEVKYVSVPQGNTYELKMYGQDTGTFALDIQESVGGIVSNTSTVANVPVTANTLASLTITDGVSTASALRVDKNGDNTSIINVTPKVGEYVNYVARRSRWKPAPVAIIDITATTSPLEDLVLRSASTIPVVIESAAISTPATSPEAAPQPIAESTLVSETVTQSWPSKPASIALASTRSAYQEQASSSLAIAETIPQDVPKTSTLLPQTASVYDGSQEGVSGILTIIAYATVIISGLWFVLTKFFLH